MAVASDGPIISAPISAGDAGAGDAGVGDVSAGDAGVGDVSAGAGEATPTAAELAAHAEAQAIGASLRGTPAALGRIDTRTYTNTLLEKVISVPGLDVAVSTVERLLDWASSNSFFIFPMATSCCGIEFMAAAASRVDLDRMGAIIRPTPRQCDVMVVAGTITVKMAPRVRKLWDQMPEPKWCVAMGSCAISGDFYRDIYSVVPGVDTFIPVDVYVPGCPPNPEELMKGLKRLQEKIKMQREGTWEQSGVPAETRPETSLLKMGGLARIGDPNRATALSDDQREASRSLGFDGLEHRPGDREHGHLLEAPEEHAAEQQSAEQQPVEQQPVEQQPAGDGGAP